MRKIYRHCALCKKEIYDGDDFVIETDRRGIITRMYHRKCVFTRKAPDRPKIEPKSEFTVENIKKEQIIAVEA